MQRWAGSINASNEAAASESKIQAMAASKECEAFEKHRTNFDWLRLVTENGQEYLGCALRVKNKPRSSMDKFIAGKYSVGKYLYARTFKLHVESAVRQKQLQHELEPCAPERPVSVERAGSSGSTATSLEGSPASASSGTQSTPRGKSLVAIITHELLSVYVALHQMWSVSVWAMSNWLSRKVGGQLSASHDSSTVFDKYWEFLTSDLQEQLADELKGCHGFSVAVDEKETEMACVIHFVSANWNLCGRLLTYRELHGFTAQEITKAILESLAKTGINMDLMRGFTADGASVMGTRKEFGTGGSHVYKLLQDSVPVRMLNTHCAGHKVQLAIADALRVDAYLQTLDRAIRGLFRWLRAHPRGKLDLCFWAEICEEEYLTQLGTGKARWLSLRDPVCKIHKSYHTLLCHLRFSCQEEREREKKKQLAELFQFMASWEFRVVLAGMADVLDIAWIAKCKLGQNLTMREVLEARDRLCKEMQQFCQKNGYAADAFVRCGQPRCQDRRTLLPTRLEQMLDIYARAGHMAYELKYLTEEKGQLEFSDLGSLSEFVFKLLSPCYPGKFTIALLVQRQIRLKLKPLTNPESSEEQQKQQAKDIFKRLSAFSEACQEKVFDRFPNVAVYAHFSSLLEVTDARARLPLEHVSGLASFYQVPE